MTEFKSKKKKKRFALKFSFKRGLEIKAPGMKLKISRDQLLFGSGIVLALTPVGPTALATLGNLASKASAIGAKVLPSVLTFMQKNKTSMFKACKALGINPEQALKEWGDLVKQPDVKGLIDNLAKESEADPDVAPGGFSIPTWVLIAGAGLGGIVLFNIFRRK